MRLASPLNCGAWDKKLLKQYRVHKPSSLSYEPEMRSKLIFEIPFFGYCVYENHVGDEYYFKEFYSERKERKGIVIYKRKHKIWLAD